jgi:broad specificity phosphatase PhoE
MDRLRGFLDDAAGLHPSGVVLAVSHENPILAAMALTGDDPGKVVHRNIANCEWVELVWPAV